MKKPVKFKNGYLFGFEIGGGIAMLITGGLFSLLLFAGSCLKLLGFLGVIIAVIPLLIWGVGYVNYLFKLRKYYSSMDDNIIKR